MKVWLDPNSLNTNFILGAALTGGDVQKAAKALCKEKKDVRTTSPS